MGFNEKQIDEIMKADVLEWDGYKLVGWGSHADYDSYAMEVQNGQGYYDDDGHFRRYAYNYED